MMIPTIHQLAKLRAHKRRQIKKVVHFEHEGAKLRAIHIWNKVSGKG